MNSFADSDSHLAEAGAYSTSVVIGGLPIGIQSSNRGFIAMLENRYAGFLDEPVAGGILLDVEVVASVSDTDGADEDIKVRYADGRWLIDRGDFRATWDPVSRRGRVRP